MLQEILKVTLYKGNRYINVLFCTVLKTDSVFHPHSKPFHYRYKLQFTIFIILSILDFVFSGHQEILRQEGKCQLYDPAPLVLVKDIMTYMPQIKYMFSNLASEQQPPSKRQKV